VCLTINWRLVFSVHLPSVADYTWKKLRMAITVCMSNLWTRTS
jgi:hypothetical protein